MTDLLWRKPWFRLIGCAVICGLALPGCGGDDGGRGEGPGRRSQVIALSAQQEVKLGDEAFQEVLAKEHVVKGAEAQRVEEIGEKIFHEALENMPLRREINLRDADAQGRPWNFKDRKYAVLQEQEINAFCLPGGKVAVFTGLIDMTEKNDDWLATVLGHEIAHALAHHASERIGRENMYAQASDSSVGGFGLLDRTDRWKLIDLLGAGSHAVRYADDKQPDQGERSVGVFQQIRELSFDRQQEAEADHIGIFLMTFAGYDPDQAVAFWQAMADRSRTHEPPEILSDHPSDAHRVAAMRGWAVRAKDALLAWKAGRIAH